MGAVVLSSGLTEGARKEAKKEEVDYELVVSFMTCLGLSNTFWELCSSIQSTAIQKH